MDISPRVRLARASDIPVEAVEVEVGIVAGVFIRPDEIVDVEIEISVGEHWRGAVMRAKFEGYAEWEDAKAVGGWWQFPLEGFLYTQRHLWV